MTPTPQPRSIKRPACRMTSENAATLSGVDPVLSLQQTIGLALLLAALPIILLPIRHRCSSRGSRPAPPPSAAATTSGPWRDGLVRIASVQ